MNATEAKRRVLAVHPGAGCEYDKIIGKWLAYVDKDAGDHFLTLAFGVTDDEAWIAAAAGLEERNER